MNLRSLQENDEAAWQDLWKKICQWCDYWVIYVYHFDDEVADEAKYDTFVRIRRSLPSLEITVSLLGFCRKVSYHASIDAIKKAAKRQNRELSWEASTLSKSEHLLDLSVLEPCWSQLSELERKVLWSYYVDGLEYPEIAETHGITPNYARVLHFRGLRKLQACSIDRGCLGPDDFRLDL